MPHSVRARRLRAEQTQPKEGCNGKQNKRFSTGVHLSLERVVEKQKRKTYKEGIAKDPAGRRATGIQIKEGAQARRGC